MSYYPGNDIRLGTDRITGEPVMLRRGDRARHTYICGGTRTGKTKLVEHMAREDIIQWPNDRCPMVLLDPHGTLYKSLMAFVVAEDLKEWPIIPVDLSRGDLVVSYNLLRRRDGVDPSVICRALIDAIIYAWGQANTNQTARLATWLHTLLMLAYERDHTLTEALQIIANPELRQLITREIQDFVVRSVIQSVEHIREKEFQERVESTLYRINRFLSGQVLRATFCQKGASLDLGEVLDQGKILLVNLSVEGTNIHAEDAAVFGSVMLTDLWTAANRRGKREEGERPPCYVYVDEFQNFVGPTIAKGMAEASGFGLHLHLINQWPSQLLAHGEDVGRLVLDSVLNNAQNKIVFKLEHPDDLEMLTRILFRQSVDPQRIKDELISPTVVGYDLQYHTSFNRSTTRGTMHSIQESYSRSHGRTVTASHSTTLGTSTSSGTTKGTSESQGTGVSDTAGLSQSEGTSVSHGTGESESDSTSATEGETEQWAKSQSAGSGTSKGTGKNRSQTQSFNELSEALQDELDEYLNDAPNEIEEDAFKRKWAAAASLTEGDSSSDTASENQSSSESTGGGRSRSAGQTSSRARSTTANEGHTQSIAKTSSEGRSRSVQRGSNRSTQQSTGFSFAASAGMSESESAQETHGSSEGFSESESETHGEAQSPMLMPVLENRVSSRQFKSVDEQLFEMSQLIDAQRLRQCFIRLASAKTPVPTLTPIIEPPRTTEPWAMQNTTRIIQALPFMLPFPEADKNVRERQVTLLGTLRQLQTTDEPVTHRRRLHARVITDGKKTEEKRG